MNIDDIGIDDIVVIKGKADGYPTVGVIDYLDTGVGDEWHVWVGDKGEKSYAIPVEYHLHAMEIIGNLGLYREQINE